MSPTLLVTIRQVHPALGLSIGEVWDAHGQPYRFPNVVGLWAR